MVGGSQTFSPAGDTSSTIAGRSFGEILQPLICQASVFELGQRLEMGGVEPTEGSAALLCENPSPIETCEIVDKVFYRSGNGVNLRAVNFDYAGDKFLQEDGNVLSDHDPVLVEFEWSISP